MLARRRKAGEKDEAARRLSEYLNSLEEGIANKVDNVAVRYDIAAIHAVRGDKDQAIGWVQRAVDAGYVDARQLSMDPLFENLRDDARFKQVVTQLEAKAAEIRQEIGAME